MTEYIERDAISEEIRKYYYKNPPNFSYGEGFDRGLDRAQRAILDAPAVDVAPVQKWISVKDKLPEPEQEVLVCVRSKISNYSYVCCAMYVPENWYRQSSDFCWDFECCDEYDEEQDDYIVKQGWYESIHNWDDYSVVGIEDIVTHWMPIPQPPKGE